ncbi:MAG TPA: plastocyanin/azurin family copper-binding protein [Gemmatimonadales bacterium]|nr:plastocyanin/azurin family copper-binding protein [Gemmatimonadales bacterium]
MTNDQFTPQVLNVSSGTQVNFVWGTGSVNHNVTPVPPAPIPSSGNLPTTRNAPFSFQVTFPTPGTFNYFCSIHGAAGAGMHGSIVVQ